MDTASPGRPPSKDPMAAREATATRRAHVAVFDANTLIAKGIKEQLVSRSFPLASVRLFTSKEDPDSNLTEFDGEAMFLTQPDPDALGSLDIAFLCGSREDGARYLEWPVRKGFIAIDLTTRSNAREDVPLVNAGVNPEAIAPLPGVIATPHPISQLLSTLLAPIVRKCGLREAAAVVFQPASEAGEEGIDELYRQAVSLMNFQDMPRDVFGRQIAFNLVPTFLYEAEKVPGGAWPAALEREVLKITGGRYGLSVDVVLVPVFHCHAVLASLRLPAGKTREDILASFRSVEEIRVASGGEAATPIDRAGKPGTLVAGIRETSDPSSFWLWAVNDNLQSGSAQNAVRIAESLLAKGLGRVDQ
jgi:aspartate-semialdehyde dehydrogenase